ncbi:hypothetical protein GX586_10690 [bacterium]|nr:hypothetical protein [bacterium]
MRDLKGLGVLLLGFFPWILFLGLSGKTLASLERATVTGLAASLLLGLRELKRGYILQWGTLIFFAACVVSVNLLKIIWVARNMDLLANGALALTMWVTVIAGMPFALQYARNDVPKDYWQNPAFIRGCYQITIVWAGLMTLATAVSVLRRTPLLHLPDSAYFVISVCIIVAGLAYTTMFRRRKRLQRERAAA